MSEIVRASTAARRLGVHTKLLSHWKRTGKISNPGHGIVRYEECIPLVSDYLKNSRSKELGAKDPPYQWKDKPTKVDRDKADKTLPLRKVRTPTINY